MCGPRRIERFLEDIRLQSPESFEIVCTIRELFLASSPDLQERIKYGGLVFMLSDRLVGGIFLYSRHISVEFSNGASLRDPDKVLEGKGKTRRHVKITRIDDIRAKSLDGFIRAATA